MQRKHLMAIFLFVMIVVVPYLSWRFLKGGYNYRMQSLNELAQKKTLGDTTMLYPLGMKNKVTWIVVNGSDSIVNGIYQQFKSVDEFYMITTNATTDTSMKNKKYLSPTDSIGGSFYGKLRPDTRYAVVDDSMYIRREYMRDDEVVDMVKHLATLLPFVEKNKRKKN